MEKMWTKKPLQFRLTKFNQQASSKIHLQEQRPNSRRLLFLVRWAHWKNKSGVGSHLECPISGCTHVYCYFILFLLHLSLAASEWKKGVIALLVSEYRTWAPCSGTKFERCLSSRGNKSVLFNSTKKRTKVCNFQCFHGIICLYRFQKLCQD